MTHLSQPLIILVQSFMRVRVPSSATCHSSKRASYREFQSPSYTVISAWYGKKVAPSWDQPTYLVDSRVMSATESCAPSFVRITRASTYPAEGGFTSAH